MRIGHGLASMMVIMMDSDLVHEMGTKTDVLMDPYYKRSLLMMRYRWYY